jgi:hypothetical protein
MTTSTRSSLSEQDVKESAEQVGVSPRTCSAKLTNSWNVQITSLTVTHRSGDHTDTFKASFVNQGGTTDTFQIIYVTGAFAPHDYWWVEFTATGGKEPGTWTCKDNFYCDLRAEDENTTVTLTVDKNSVEMQVAETSGNCSVSLHHP